MSAVLLPYRDGDIDWLAFERHLTRTVDAGLVPAVNMDTGFVQLLAPDERLAVLDRVQALGIDEFVAGAVVDDTPGSRFDGDGYRRAFETIQQRGGTPIVFPSYGLSGPDDLADLATGADRFLAFELSPRFAPVGRIWSLDDWACLLDIPQCVGAKHSSLSRQAEWDRLALRDERRPEFLVLTGNDLAIDMVMWGSDYLLGLSTFAPEAFAERDRLWADGDAAFFELNDRLQALGAFAFREPVPAYRHDAALLLGCEPHPKAPLRPHPEAELETLRALWS
jgi:dihydrodipicolinate synthase/N-acetylneuraminate lyase